MELMGQKMSDLLKQRGLPDLGSKEQMKEILQTEIYGKMPPPPDQTTYVVENNMIPNFCAGKAVCNRVTAHCLLGKREFSFPFYVTLPQDGNKHPFFIHINFRSNVTDYYQPTEELIDHGFAVLSFDYNDVTKDNDDFRDGLAGVLFENGVRGADDAGKIAMWAWGAHRVMDYAETLTDVLDLGCATVCGHSRLGKTALVAGAMDERFAFVYSNDSGCSGAAITRGKMGENISAICHHFSHWFCKNYQKYIDREDKMPFDQHFLVASIAPRKVLVGSASEDLWADPVSEQLCCFAAAPAFEKGFVCPDRKAEIGEGFLAGDLGYHLRDGAHYFSRHDWHRLIEFIKLHI